MKLTNYIKKKLGITSLENKISQLEEANLALKSKLASKETEINSHLATLREFTRIDADVGFRRNNTIVLTGYIGNRGYVRFYDIGDGEFKRLVEYTKDLQKHGKVRSIDEPSNSGMMKGAICGGWEL